MIILSNSNNSAPSSVASGSLHGKGAHRTETSPDPQRKSLPKCRGLGPGRLRKSISVGVRVSFREVRCQGPRAAAAADGHIWGRFAVQPRRGRWPGRQGQEGSWAAAALEIDPVEPRGRGWRRRAASDSWQGQERTWGPAGAEGQPRKLARWLRAGDADQPWQRPGPRPGPRPRPRPGPRPGPRQGPRQGARQGAGGAPR